MTRTARAAYPRAVIKDRSESRSGLDSSLRKAGAGHHNWGSLADERQLEFAALNDQTFEEEELTESVTAATAEDTNSTRSTRCKFHFSLHTTYLFMPPQPSPQQPNPSYPAAASAKCPRKSSRRRVSSGRTRSRRQVVRCISSA
jgi:hypothetical protein